MTPNAKYYKKNKEKIFEKRMKICMLCKKKCTGRICCECVKKNKFTGKVGRAIKRRIQI